MFRRVVAACLCFVCPPLGLLYAGHPALAAAAPLLALLPWVVPIAVYAAGLDPGGWFLAAAGGVALAGYLLFPALALGLRPRSGLGAQRAEFYVAAVYGWFVALAAAGVLVYDRVLV